MPTDNVWLSRFAKLVIFATLCLIFIGGHTTTSGAGMAFADWPLSRGSVNPAGWWENLMTRLEHGHRLMAETVGLLIGVLCAWVWRSKWAVPVSFGASILLAVVAKLAGAPPKIVAHVGLWSSAVIFAVWILALARRNNHAHFGAVRWLAFAAFAGVIAQAILGGLRVTIETSGDISAATAFRVIHGCFAHVELCLLICIAEMLRAAPRIRSASADLRGASWLGWIAAASVFLQLVVGATMRHLGAGLIIPTFPRMPDGGWMPKVHNVYFDLNFTHTRFGALLVTLLIVALAWRVLARARGDTRFTVPALLLLLLVVAQVTMGMFIIWKFRPPMLATLHVVNGAAILGTTVLLALRAARTDTAAAERAAAPVSPMLQNVST